MKFPKPALYHIYADTSPSGIGQQVLRFDLSVGGSFPHVPVTLKPSALENSSGAYMVKFDTLTLKAGGETMLPLRILKSGKPAEDIRPFLGVAAHAVFIDADTLDYLHAHPHAMKGGGMDMSGGNMAEGHMTGPSKNGIGMDPELMLHAEAPQPGLYALWIQFNGGGTLQTVPFVAVAR
jgi:hypothetical protein